MSDPTPLALPPNSNPSDGDATPPNPALRGASDARIGIGIAGLAGAWRLSVLFDSAADPTWTFLRFDEQFYHEQGLRIAAGDWALDAAVLQMSPLYTAVVGFAYALSVPSHTTIAVLQQAMGVVTTLLVYALMRRWSSMTASAIVALLYTVTAPVLFYELHLAPDTLLALLVTGTTLAWLQASDAPQQLRRWALVGGLLGLTILTRPNWVLVVPVLLASAWLWTGAPRRIHATAVAAMTVACVLAPVALRNAIRGGDAVLVAASGGVNLYIGNGPDANGAFRRPDGWQLEAATGTLFLEATRIASDAAGRTLTAAEADTYWRQQAVAHMVANPGRTVALWGRKLRMSLQVVDVPNNRSYAFERRHLPLIGSPLLPQLGWVLLPGLLGLGWMIVRRRDRAAVILAVMGVVVPLGTLVGFFVLGRYRMPWVPLLAVGAGVAGTWVVAALARRDWRVAVPALVIGIGGWAASHTGPPPRSFAQDHFLRGFELYRAGATPESIPHFEAALASPSLRVLALRNLAIALAEVGRVREADARLEELLRETQQDSQLQEDATRMLEGLRD